MINENEIENYKLGKDQQAIGRRVF
jgi:hypothetical protein